MTTYLIIGNGVAGNAAAENIRKHDPEGKIVVFSRESRPFYYVPALPEYLAGEKAADQIILHQQSWYDQRRIDLYLDTRVTQIDAAQKFVETDKGERFPFDKLLLATGGNSFVPPIKGADSPGVFTLRTLADADRIKAGRGGSQDRGVDRRRPPGSRGRQRPAQAGLEGNSGGVFPPAAAPPDGRGRRRHPGAADGGHGLYLSPGGQDPGDRSPARTA